MPATNRLTYRARYVSDDGTVVDRTYPDHETMGKSLRAVFNANPNRVVKVTAEVTNQLTEAAQNKLLGLDLPDDPIFVL